MDFLSKEGGRRWSILASDKNKKDQKNVRIKLTWNLTSRLFDHKATNLETRNKKNGSKFTNHLSQTMTFWARSSKYVFPKRSAKITDGTEKAKIPSKFAKRTVRYNKFRYK